MEIKASLKKCVFSLEQKDELEVAVGRVTGSEFHGLGAATEESSVFQ